MDTTGHAQVSRSVALRDAEGQPTDDPALAVAGEVLEHDAHGRLGRRTRFAVREVGLPSWMPPVGEAAFLLWVLVALFAAWIVIAVILRLT
jgi:hypothetical protein